MPKEVIVDNTGIVEQEQYDKDKETFESTVDALLSADEDKTDEEIIKDLDDKTDGPVKKDEASGDATQDPEKPAEGDVPKVADTIDDLIAADQAASGDDPTKVPDTGSTPVSIEDWQQKAELAEAELKKERQKTASWNGRITKANTRVEELTKELEDAKAAKPAPSDDGADSDTVVLERFRKDFPEMIEVFDILEKRIESNKSSKAKDPEPAAASPDVSTEPIDTSTQMTTIRDVHPDLDEMVNTGVLRTWINQQADYMRPHLDTIYKSGTPDQVIDMVKRFKEASGWKSQLDQQGSSKKKTSQDKLDSMREVNSESGGAPAEGPDKEDYDGAAKEAFSEK
jgi:hypothetical protein